MLRETQQILKQPVRFREPAPANRKTTFAITVSLGFDFLRFELERLPERPEKKTYH
jgi:hypothetical protein